MNQANILDYMQWRGDLKFEKSPFNEIDSLILSQIVYLPFEGIVPSVRSTRTITVRRAAEKFFAMYERTKSSIGALIPAEIFQLFRLAGESERFGNIRLGWYVNKIDTETELQFCAMTLFIDDIGEIYIDYRGTDDTIVGWKEDFNMGFMTPVPAQTEAVHYFNSVVGKYTKSLLKSGMDEQEIKIRLGGHSKGGNLAVYSATYAKAYIRRMVVCVYNHDGPGFDDKVIESREYQEIKSRIKTFVPQSSVVGMLLGHEEDYTVVKSHQVGLLQHDAFSWELMGTHFICVDSVTDASLVLDRTLKAWIGSMDAVSAERFVTALFEILSATDARTLTELMAGKNKALGAMLKAYSSEDEETKKMLKTTVKSMVDVWKSNFKIRQTT